MSLVSIICFTVSCIYAREVCLNREDYDLRRPDLYGFEDTGYDEYDYGYNDGRDSAPVHPCHELKRILSGGTFYYSTTFDLTNCLQDR